jgi:hypothetical protein
MGRRVRIERNLYESVRADGRRRLEVGYRDSLGKQRWRVLGEVGIKQARAERDEILGKRGKGEKDRAVAAAALRRRRGALARRASRRAAAEHAGRVLERRAAAPAAPVGSPPARPDRRRRRCPARARVARGGEGRDDDQRRAEGGGPHLQVRPAADGMAWRRPDRPARARRAAEDGRPAAPAHLPRRRARRDARRRPRRLAGPVRARRGDRGSRERAARDRVGGLRPGRPRRRHRDDPGAGGPPRRPAGAEDR